jgi:filamentous hemagglutinin
MEDFGINVGQLRHLLTETGGFDKNLKVITAIRKVFDLGAIDIADKTVEQILAEVYLRYPELEGNILNIHFYSGNGDIDVTSLDEATIGKLRAEGIAVTKDGSIWINTDHKDNNNSLAFNKLLIHEYIHLVGGNEGDAQYAENTYGGFLSKISSSGYLNEGGIKDWGKTQLAGSDRGRINGYAFGEMDFKIVKFANEAEMARAMDNINKINDYLTGGLLGAKLYVKIDGKLFRLDRSGIEYIYIDGTTLDITSEKFTDDEIAGDLYKTLINEKNTYITQITKRREVIEGSGVTPFVAIADDREKTKFALELVALGIEVYIVVQSGGAAMPGVALLNTTVLDMKGMNPTKEIPKYILINFTDMNLDDIEVLSSLISATANAGAMKIYNNIQYNKQLKETINASLNNSNGANQSSNSGNTNITNNSAILDNGKLSTNNEALIEGFSGKSIDAIAKDLENAGYKIEIVASTNSRSGAQIIQISNTVGTKNITQVQVSPGGGRHGELPYVKISTSTDGKIKIVDGIPSLYKTDGKENAKIIFTGGKK